MGRRIKKELLKTAALMEEANRTVGSMNRNQRSAVMDILIQCQEAAQQIGGYLETLNNSALIPLLEEYCENLYLMSQYTEDHARYMRLSKLIGKQLASLRKKLCEELPDGKWEIVFLPYKASMWDSLESVWEAAAQDEQCDVYVVPIPYFDKNPDGTLGQMHYEGDCYPKNVPVTAWRTYNFAKRRPDIVYIHNPYDQYNYVTSVHPNFYAAELKQYTDMLVYIPYFVSTDHHVGEHFCTLPGVFYADRVIVEDDEIRNIYRKNCGGVFGKTEDKFLALGSPKFDKVISTKREDVSVPLEWKPFLYREDGSRKKVVFYNTTVDALLKNGEYVEKIKSVLGIFYEYRDEVTLLWRPHPLNLATMRAMRPKNLMEYQKTVEEYKAAGYGIYDDTSDLHRAIALSDIYYGDWSSVVSLYEKTGKPVYYQTDGKRFIYFSSMFVYQGDVYGFSCNNNMMIKIDFMDRRTCYFMKLNNKSEDNGELYFSSIVCRDKLFMIPAADSDMLIYDFIAGTYERVRLCPPENFFGQTKFYFIDVCRYGNYLYLIPFHYGCIVRYDLDTGRLKSIPLYGETDDKNCLKFGFLEYMDGGRIAIPAGNSVILFDLETETWEKHMIFGEGGRMFHIERVFFYKQALWLLPTDKLVFLKWDYVSGSAASYADFPKSCKETDNNFGGHLAQRIDNFIYCFPAQTNMAVKINLENGIISELTALKPFCEAKEASGCQRIFANLIAAGKKILLQYLTNQMVVYDTEKDAAYAFGRELSNTASESRKMNKDFTDEIFRPRTPLSADKERAGRKIHSRIKKEAEAIWKVFTTF